MHRGLLGVAAWMAALVFAAAATAAELPVARDGVASCLRATGDPGALALSGPLTSHVIPTTLARAGAPDRLDPLALVVLGRLEDCAATATRDGATILAGVDRRYELRPSGDDDVTTLTKVVAVSRSADGALGAVRSFAGPEAEAVAVAAGPSGHRVVAWVQKRRPSRDRTAEETVQRRVVLSRSGPDGVLGPPTPLTAWRRGSTFTPAPLAVGLDAAGTATVLAAVPGPADRTTPGPASVVVVSVAAGTAPGSPQTLDDGLRDVTRVELEVAPDGRALLAYAGSGRVDVHERVSAGAPLLRVHTAGGDYTRSAEDVAIALDDGGAAVVSWREARYTSPAKAGEGVATTGLVVARSRAGAGDFGPERVLDPGRRTSGDFSSGSSLVSFGASGDPGPPLDEAGTRLRAAVGADGRFVLAWIDPAADVTGVGVVRAVGGTAVEAGATVRLSGPCRAPNGVSAFIRGDGVPAVAWTTNAGQTLGFAEVPAGDGLLETAAPVARASAPAPVASVLPQGPTPRARYGGTLRLRVGCDRPCVVRAVVQRRYRLAPRFPFEHVLVATGYARASGDAPASLELVSATSARLPARTDVHVSACSPDGVAARTSVVRIRTRPQPAPLPPRIVRATATRRGQTILVRVRFAGPVRRARVAVGVPSYRVTDATERSVLHASTSGRGRESFVLRLRGPATRSFRRVEVVATSTEPPYWSRRRTISVR